MPLTRNDIDKLSVDRVVKSELHKMRQSPVIFSNLNLIPTEAVWVMTVEDVERQVRNIASTYLGNGEIQDVTIWFNGKATPTVWVWLNRMSKHLVDTSYNSPDNLIQTNVDRYSDQLKQLCDQFAPLRDSNGRDIPRKKRIEVLKDVANRSLSGVKLDLIRLVQRFFDVKNNGFMETYGGDSARACTVYVRPISEGRDDKRRVTAFKITKTYADSGLHRRPIPAFRDNNRGESSRDTRSYDGEHRYRD